jgi:hypothetical protein
MENNNNQNSNITEQLDANMERIEINSLALIDIAQDSVTDPSEIDEIKQRTREKFDELIDSIDDLGVPDNVSDKKRKLDLEEEVCDTLTKSVSDIDRIYRNDLSRLSMPDIESEYDQKMMELENDISVRRDMVEEQKRILDEEEENSQPTGSLTEDYANPALEPGD